MPSSSLLRLSAHLQRLRLTTVRRCALPPMSPPEASRMIGQSERSALPEQAMNSVRHVTPATSGSSGATTPPTSPDTRSSGRTDRGRAVPPARQTVDSTMTWTATSPSRRKTRSKTNPGLSSVLPHSARARFSFLPQRFARKRRGGPRPTSSPQAPLASGRD